MPTDPVQNQTTSQQPTSTSSAGSISSRGKKKLQHSRVAQKKHRLDEHGLGGLAGLDGRLEMVDSESLIPPGVRYTESVRGQLKGYKTRRNRLYDLFDQIEREFETVHADNLALRHQIEVLNDKLEQVTGEKPSVDLTEGGKPLKKQEKPGSQISQKLKNTYKTSTSRIVSSFRATSAGCNLVREFRGHRDGVWEVSVSKSDPHVIGTASADHSARIWWTQNSACLLQYLGHNGSVNSIRFHPSQDMVISGSGDYTAHVWRAHVSKPPLVESVKAQSSEDELDGSEREDLDAQDSPDVDKSDPACIRTPSMELQGHSSVVIAADWLAGGSQAITASWDRMANLYDVETGDIINTLTGHDQELTNVCCHSSQKLVVTSSKDTTFRLWDFRDPNMKVNVFQGHTQPVTSAVFAGVDKVVSGSDDRTCRVWDLKNMRSPIATIRTDSAINRLSVHQFQQKIAIPQDNRHIRVYDLNGERIVRLPRSNRQGHNRMVCATAWSDRDNALCNLYSCGFDRLVFGWNINLQPKE